MVRVQSGIRGISRTTLWSSWKEIRKELRSASVRDAIDYIDFDINPNVWINRLIHQLASGAYEPSPPRRFTLGKSKGFSRTMTMPEIPDLVLFRAIVDQLRKRSRTREHEHVYFLRSQLSRAQKQAAAEAKAKMASYKVASSRSFTNWLRYDQYRKLLLMRRVGRHFVITDIANFFDSILHTHVQEALHRVDVPDRLAGLLFLLLERLSIRHDYSSSHGISLPVDEFDCSRTLAHMVLYPHDDEVVRAVGENNYVRWMDDQNMIVENRAHGLRVLSVVGRSLARLHLTPNGQKTKILTLSEARRHFHLDLNALLENMEKTAARLEAGDQNAFTELRKLTTAFWKRARQMEPRGGEFSKILKRTYRLAGLAKLRLLRSRAKADAMASPDLIERICAYIRNTGTPKEYVDFVFALIEDPEQVYPDVRREAVEGLLLLEADTALKAKIRTHASECLRKPRGLPDEELAALLILRFGDRRSLPLLRNSIAEAPPGLSRDAQRACALVYASYGSDQLKEVRRLAGQMLNNPVVYTMRLLSELKHASMIPDSIKARLFLSKDSVSGRRYLDIRIILVARLILLSRSNAVRAAMIQWRDQKLPKMSAYEQATVRKLIA